MIFEGSRYKYTNVYDNNGKRTFENRTRLNFSLDDCYSYSFKSTDRLDILAYEYYGDAQLWWVIMDANPSYDFEFDIKAGDTILIPTKKAVDRAYVKVT